MGNKLQKRLAKLKQRQNSFAKGRLSKRGSSGYKMAGSMNLHKQLSNKK